FPLVQTRQPIVFPAREYSREECGRSDVGNEGVLMPPHGYLEKEMAIPGDGMYQLDLYAASTDFPDAWAQARVSVGSEFSHVYMIDYPSGTFPVTAAAPPTVRFSARGFLHTGKYPVRIEY